MSKKIILLIITQALILSSCGTSEDEVVLNSMLIGAKSHYVGEPTDPESHKYNQLANQGKVEIKIEKGFIMATTWYIVNACGNGQANLKTRNDTIELLYQETSEELCMSLSIDEVTYVIDNPENKEWVILK